jgi:hypothetical protein
MASMHSMMNREVVSGSTAVVASTVSSSCEYVVVMIIASWDSVVPPLRYVHA